MKKACWILLVGSVSWGQGARATLGGRVTDRQGAIIPYAAVVATSDETGVKQQTRTNDQGNWTVQYLVPGKYRIRSQNLGVSRLGGVADGVDHGGVEHRGNAVVPLRGRGFVVPGITVAAAVRGVPALLPADGRSVDRCAGEGP